MEPAPAPPPDVRRVSIEVAPKTIALVVAVLAGIWLLGQLLTVLAVVVVALILVGTFEPLVQWLGRRGLRRGRALVLVFVAAALVLTAVVLLMVPPLVGQLLALIEDAPKMRERTIAALEGHGWAKPLIKAMQDLPVEDIGARAGSALLGYSTQLAEAIAYGLSTLFLAIYIMAEPGRSKALVYAVVPRHHHVKFARILLELRAIVGGYVRGQLITSLAISAFVFVLLLVIGADNALAIALFAGLTDIIPFVGGYIASTPVVLAALPMGVTTTVIVLVVMVLYQEFESRILVPRVYGRALRLAPAIVLIALLVGGTLAGILGALLALPIAAGLQMILRELRFELPGEPTTEESHRLDDRANEVYEQLTEGVPASEARVVAEDLANIVKQTEEGHGTLAEQIATVPPPPAKPAG